MHRLLPLLVLPLTLLLGTTTPATAAPSTAASAASKASAGYATTAHAATNRARAARGLVPLRQSDCLVAYAQAQAERMAAAGELSHQDLGRVMGGCDLRTAGENVAYGYSSGRAVVRTGWMHSSGHRANILAKAYRMEAIAAVRDGQGRWWVAQVFGRRG